MSERTKDIVTRALKTFIQGFLGALAITIPTSDLTNITVMKSALIGAVASAISAVMNFIVNLLKNEEDDII